LVKTLTLTRANAAQKISTIVETTGGMLRAARGVVDLAERAGLCRHSIRKWETSSDAVPGAMYPHLCRLIDALENEVVRFSGDGLPAARLHQ
jgi:hypothetical protein